MTLVDVAQVVEDLARYVVIVALAFLAAPLFLVAAIAAVLVH